jgi:hypothetical protein
MKRKNVASSALLILAAFGTSLAFGDEPIGWGAPAGAKGCVIFRESEKIDVRSSEDELKTTARSTFVLDVVTSDGYTLPRTSWPDDHGTMDQLQGIATQDRVHFVKLKDHYSTQDLEAAQASCRQAMLPLQ